MTPLGRKRLRHVSAPLFPVAWPTAQVHDSEDLQFIAPDAENQCIGKDIETALAQLSFETPMNLRVGHHAVFGILPFCQKPGLESCLLLSIPHCGFESFFAGSILVIHPHGSNRCAKALVDLFPEGFGGDEFCVANVDVTDPPPQFYAPLRT